ncbi:hypothetical protein A2304_00845 [Candidatus Uhrbacteria bacterium RIFOXYB2_FULL_57_15]|uniref:Response regulatory domain-containing protein n=1 Tax=Candidatus Uhrbacteria bacterium RIFOXYB2_FULL_57_15 TaxID=1802422 RepID=A0A1F7W5I0_9BACT|nr:MAG: hypothetical protein A2304_00845 [Candidatus Uhrbacteria bacterium RIFOXYB2_FULL_57_15]OGL99287.1 MAG: hypothetical protein A2501_03945 [Candidatus Uhrbacteria bacterium RIFOXYC12_FULL_57_11]
MKTGAEKKILLIIEDDEILLRALYLTFQKKNYTIATATDGESALKMTERMKPGLILLDLIIPKMDGFEYLKNMKSNAKLAKIPVIVLSNLGTQEDIDRAKELGAMDYFVKSDTNLSDLAKKVEKVLAG